MGTCLPSESISHDSVTQRVRESENQIFLSREWPWASPDLSRPWRGRVQTGRDPVFLHPGPFEISAPRTVTQQCLSVWTV